jgi:hypothetical protein
MGIQGNLEVIIDVPGCINPTLIHPGIFLKVGFKIYERKCRI